MGILYLSGLPTYYLLWWFSALPLFIAEALDPIPGPLAGPLLYIIVIDIRPEIKKLQGK